MKIELDIDVDELIQISTGYCEQLEKGDMTFYPVKDPDMIMKLIQTGLMETGLIENDDGYWTIGRRDGEHVLMEFKPFS
ncbi:hypothetical protein HQQ94_20590 [Shewanella sp. VB17]|uniref:hypothetical protein n=1 Tax=Shewanella sp. VB17 TaxID=2739432 RepID=UPI001564458E|nr:hypothetical protein [Shewanella sp. VB17]NRD75572.1 hypothetical protein [Shewanella sp. VB17]